MNITSVLDYHQRTKHQLNAYAKGPASLDWDDQPNPFRRFSGCELVQLPQPGRDLDITFIQLDRPELIGVHDLNLSNLGLLLELAFGLSAWKQYGPDRWALRCNPSSGNLHPTEAYLLCSDPAILTPGVYHYLSHDHVLEQRCHFINSPAAGVYIGLSSVHWREAWKYGERAFRYCQHDIGHALAALSYAASCLGWQIELVSELADAKIAAVLGLDRAEDFIVGETESADLLCRIYTDASTCSGFDVGEWLTCAETASWSGQAEPLSIGRHLYKWPIIDAVAELCHKPATEIERCYLPVLELPKPQTELLASRLIRQRRSAQQFNAKADALSLDAFKRMLMAILPSAKPPFTAWNWAPNIDLLVFVHRVEGLASGLYFMPRQANAIETLKPILSAEFVWQKVDLPFEFFQWVPGNVRRAAKTLSCHQSIASDSAFSLGMLVPFGNELEQSPWLYKRWFWECGLIGQVLYLEAEAAGVRGTGIGCFFDDAVHGVLGLKDSNWQSLYHFTVGTPLEDSRLVTLPAYQHLRTTSLGND